MATEAQILAELESSMVDMDQLVVDIKTLLYGESGTGKTVLGMQILQQFTPENKRIVFIDSARGYVSLNNHPELKRRTKRIQYEGLVQIAALANAIKQGKPGFADIGAVMVDELSSIQIKDTHVVMKGRGESTGEFAQPSQPDMGVTTVRMIKNFSPLLELPIHVILTSHLREDELKIGKMETGRMVTRPFLMPQLSGVLRGLVHEVLYLSADTKAPVGGKPTYARTLQVMPTNKIVAKTRIGGLSPTVSPATYIKALGEWIEGSRPTQKASVDSIEDETVESHAVVIE